MPGNCRLVGLSCSTNHLLPGSEKNKAFSGLRSCDNVQTEGSVFKYANWPKLQKSRTDISSWSV